MIETPDTLDLKCENPYFSHIWNGDKEFEVRKNDRNYHLHQLVRLKEYNRNANTYTGRTILVLIKHILHGGQFGIDTGYCVFGFTVISKGYETSQSSITVTLDKDTLGWITGRTQYKGTSVMEEASESIRDYRDLVAYQQNMRESDHR